MTAGVQESTQNTQEVKNERPLITTRQKQCANFQVHIAFEKEIQTDKHIKHEIRKILSSKSLWKMVGEKLPPSQDRVWK